jgi:hypothetical protein
VPLSCYRNVPAERSAQLIGRLIFTGFVFGEKSQDQGDAERVRASPLKSMTSAGRLAGMVRGFDAAMAAALAAEVVLAADETPVNVLDKAPRPRCRTPRAKRARRTRTGRPPPGHRTG